MIVKKNVVLKEHIPARFVNHNSNYYLRKNESTKHNTNSKCNRNNDSTSTVSTCTIISIHILRGDQ